MAFQKEEEIEEHDAKIGILLFTPLNHGISFALLFASTLFENMRNSSLSFLIVCLFVAVTGCSGNNQAPTEEVVNRKDTIQPSLAVEEQDSQVLEDSNDVEMVAVREEEPVGEDAVIDYDTLGEPFKIELAASSGEDTLSVEAELGENPNGRRIAFITEEWDVLEVWESYETSVTIQAEGPHCDLLQWKHYYSPAKKLRPSSLENQFIGMGYHWAAFEYFPKMEVKELKRYARGFCEGWDPVIDKIEAIGEYPSNVNVSAFHFKVRAKSMKNGREERFVVRVVMPMGC